MRAAAGNGEVFENAATPGQSRPQGRGKLEAANGRKGRSVRRRRKPKPLPLSGSSGNEGPRPDAAKEASAGSNVRRGFEGGPAKASRLLPGTRSEARGSQDRKRPIRPVEICPPLAGECAETRKVGAGGNASPHYFVGCLASASAPYFRQRRDLSPRGVPASTPAASTPAA